MVEQNGSIQEAKDQSSFGAKDQHLLKTCLDQLDRLAILFYITHDDAFTPRSGSICLQGGGKLRKPGSRPPGVGDPIAKSSFLASAQDIARALRDSQHNYGGQWDLRAVLPELMGVPAITDVVAGIAWLGSRLDTEDVQVNDDDDLVDGAAFYVDRAYQRLRKTAPLPRGTLGKVIRSDIAEAVTAQAKRDSLKPI